MYHRIQGVAECLKFNGAFEGFIIQEDGEKKIAFVIGLILSDISLNDFAKRMFGKERSIEIKESSWLSGMTACKYYEALFVTGF